MLDDSASADAVVRRVLDATLSAAESRPLADLLREIADVLAEALVCRYVAISVETSDGRREHFVTAGDSEAAARLFGGPFDPHDLLGDVMAEAVTVLVPDPTPADTLSETLTPADVAAPTARLGVPILLRGRTAGGVYLGEPTDRPVFSSGDVLVIQSVALGIAGVVERARTVAANRRRDAWYETGGTLVHEIVSSTRGNPLQLIVDRALDVAEADVASIITPGEVDDTIVVSASAGTAADQWAGTVLTVPPAAFRLVVSSTRPLIVDRLADAPLPRVWRQRLGVDATLAVPLSGTNVQRGLLVMARKIGAPVFSAAEAGMAMLFANTVALALELSERQSRRDQAALLTERGRIARDLHDHVIQRLYALGLSMQSMSVKATPELGERLAVNVDEIDETIKQIRSTIFRLTTPIISAEMSLRSCARRLVDELEPALGFRASLDTEGPIDFAVDPDVVDDCVAVLREAVTNIARHAEASRADIALRVADGKLHLVISDNGRGLGDTSRRSGLANMRTRAQGYGGDLSVDTSPESGTTLHWVIPIDTTH